MPSFESSVFFSSLSVDFLSLVRIAIAKPRYLSHCISNS
nr:MAG TPA: hypothetical protein [Bacteriophage sp.]